MKVSELRIFLLGLAMCTTCSRAARDIIVFGDSYSDNGNGFAATVKLALQTNETYPQAPYYMGRWTNGPNWIDFAAKSLGSKLVDFAAGGATTGTAPAQIPPLPKGFANLTIPITVLANNIFQQYDQLLLSTNGSISSAPVYIIFIGANDILSTAFENTSVTAQPVVQNVQKLMNNLYSKGARTFILVQLPTSLSALPLFNHPSLYGDYSAALPNVDQQTAAYVSALQQLATSYNNSHPGAVVSTYSWGQVLQNVISNAANYGITNTQDAAYLPPASGTTGAGAHPNGRGGGTTVPNPAAYAFWDEVHPTTIVQQIIGDDFVNTFGLPIFGVSARISAPSPSTGAASPGTTLPVLPI